MHVGHCMCARRQTLHAHTHACVRACTHGCTSATASHTCMHGRHDARFWHACRPFMARMHVSMHAHIHMLACSNTCANTLAFIHTHSRTHTTNTQTTQMPLTHSSNIGLAGYSPTCLQSTRSNALCVLEATLETRALIVGGFCSSSSSSVRSWTSY